jgi:hypothetical protein
VDPKSAGENMTVELKQPTRGESMSERWDRMR